MTNLSEKDFLKEYKEYRLKVLSKTDGKNIHKINSFLGVILNQGKNYIYFYNKNIKKAKEILKHLKNKEKEIFELTGISFSLIRKTENEKEKSN